MTSTHPHVKTSTPSIDHFVEDAFIHAFIHTHTRAFRPARVRTPPPRLSLAVANASTTFGFRAAKLWAFTATPYDKSLYIDADAFPCASFQWLHSELSPALERYDVMATHSSMRRGFAHALHWLNAGVIAFNGHHRTRKVFTDWLRTYEAQKAPTTDQRLFNEAALRSDARIMALPPEFNCKSNYKSVRYEWLKAASPYFYRRLRKDWACCKVPSVGVCAIDHECRFPVL